MLRQQRRLPFFGPVLDQFGLRCQSRASHSFNLTNRMALHLRPLEQV